MSWEDALLDLFDDLESRAEGLAQEARDAEVAELARAEYAEVPLQARLHGAQGSLVHLEMAGGARLVARVERVGRGCAVVTSESAPRGLHLLNLTHLLAVRAESARAADEAVLPLTARLGLASAVRHLAEEVASLAVQRADGVRLVGDVVRVGADFLELCSEDAAGNLLVPLAAIVSLAPA
jgi:hypothetical protein